MSEKREKRKKEKAQRRAQLARKHEERQFQQLRAEIMAGYPLETDESKTTERPCGSCTACCEAVGVHELKKDMYQKCQHQCSAGCAIYEDRPESCRTYYCLWQIGVLKGGEETRPDNLGIIIDMRTSASPELGKRDVLNVWETREAGADEPAARKVLMAMAQRGAVIFIRRFYTKKSTLIAPEDVMAKVRRFQEQKEAAQ